MTTALILGLALLGPIDGTTPAREADTEASGRPEPRKRFLTGFYFTTNHGFGLHANLLVKPLDAPESDEPGAGFVEVARFQLCYNILVRPGARGLATFFDPLAVSLPGRAINPTLVLSAHSKLLHEGWGLDRLIAEGVPPEEEPPTRIGMRPR